MKDKSTSASLQPQAPEVMDSTYTPKAPELTLPPDKANEPPISRVLRIPFTVTTTGPDTEDDADPYALDIDHYHHDNPTEWTDIMTSWLFVLFSEALKGNRELLWDDISSAAYAEFEVRPHFYDLAPMGRMLGFHYQLVTDHEEFGQVTSEEQRSGHDGLQHDIKDATSNPQLLLSLPVNITPTKEDLQNRVSTVTHSNKLRTASPSTASLPSPDIVDAAEANNNTSKVTPRGRIDDEMEAEECDMHGFTKKQLLWLKEHGPGGKFCIFENCWKDKEVRFNEEFGQNRCNQVLFLKWASTEFSSKKSAKGEKETARAVMPNVLMYNNQDISPPTATETPQGEPPFPEGSQKSSESIRVTVHTGQGTAANSSEAARFCFGAEHDKWLRLVVPWLNDKMGKTEWKDVKRRFTRNFHLEITIEEMKRRVREVMGERQGGWSSI